MKKLIGTATTIQALERVAALYFFQPCKIEVPFVYNLSKTAVRDGFEVVKVGRKFNLVKI